MDIQNIILMTYHSAKGLDFDSVYLPLSTDATIREAALFNVALSRTKEQLMLSYTGEMHPLVQKLNDLCIDVNNVNANVDDNADIYDFDFWE